MLAIQGDTIDTAYLWHWAPLLGLRDDLRAAIDTAARPNPS